MTKLIKVGSTWIEVPEECNWLAKDENGSWWAYEEEPFLGLCPKWVTLCGEEVHLCDVRHEVIEPGYWEHQLYWIGD